MPEDADTILMCMISGVTSDIDMSGLTPMGPWGMNTIFNGPGYLAVKTGITQTVACHMTMLYISNEDIGTIPEIEEKADTALMFSPVSASENGQLTNALLVDLTNPKAAVNAPQKVGYTYTTENMPENCAWGIRTVNWVAENFLAVQINGMMLNSNTAAIWINTYNNGAWTGWICIGGVNSDGWIDITDECTWIANTSFNTGVHKKFVRYNPFTGQVIGSFYAYGEMHNQSILLTLPDYVPAEYVGACGIASTNKLMSLFPRYDSNRNIVSSHTIAENTGNRTIYMLDFFTRNSIQNIRQAQ